MKKITRPPCLLARLFIEPLLKSQILFVILAFFGLCTGTAKAGGNTFCNPLNINYRFSISSPSYREAADPTIVTFNNTYYLFASHSGGYWWSTDFKTWNLVIPTGLADIEDYAPTVITIGNTMYYTAQGGAIYKTTDPKGGIWTYVSTPFGSYDTCLFVDDDGKVYCYQGLSANGSIDVHQLDPNNNFKVIAGPIKCFSANQAAHGFEVPGDTNNNYGGDTWIEGSWMTKYNGIYYLQYANPGTQFRSYNDAVYTSSSPTGPFVFASNSPVTVKPLGYVTGTGHGCTFKDLNGKYWRADCVTISVNAEFERRLAVFPAAFDGDGLMYSNTTLGDYPQYLPGQANNSVTNNLVGWNLLSLGKTATASSQKSSSFPPGNAVDENIRTWWAAATGNSGEWLSVDLGKNCTLNAIQINFAEQDGTYWQGRTTTFSYKYKIEYSLDGSTWSMLVDKSANTNDFPHDYTELPAAVTARYVKVTNLGTVPGYGEFAISDLRVFGNGGSALPGAPTSVTATRNGDPRTADVGWNSVAGAQGYLIRYGIAPNKLYNNYEVLSGTTCAINSLVRDQDYYFTVDAFNDGGVTKGTTVVYAAADTNLRIEASSYNSENSVQTQGCAEGGLDVDFISNGSYTEYNNINLNGATMFSARVASAATGGTINIHLDSPTGTVIGTCTVPSTNGWQIYTNVSCPVSGASGYHNVYLVFTGGSGNLFNFEWFDFIGSSNTIEASSYNSENSVATENCAEGGLDVGYIGAGSYTEYTSLNLNGATFFEGRVASPGGGSTITIHLDSPTGTVIGTATVPVTGGWQNWTTINCNLSGASGIHNVYLVYTSGMNIEWFDFQAGSGSAPSLVFQNGGVYNLVCLRSGMALDNGGSTTTGNPVVQEPQVSGSTNQEWKLVDAGGGYFNLVCLTSGMALDNSGSTTSGTGVRQWTQGTNNPNQNWKFVSVGNGYYNLICQAGGMALDNGNSTTAGTQAIQWPEGTSNPNQAWQVELVPQSGSIYHLVCQTSGMALDNGGSTSNGTALTQRTDTAADSNQEWKLVSVGSGYYNLTCQSSGKAMDNGNSTSGGTQVVQWSQGSGNTNQEWQLVNVGGGQFNLICKTSGMALDDGGFTSNGTTVIQGLPWSGDPNQEWTLEFIR